jgi:hypothetical protein
LIDFINVGMFLKKESNFLRLLFFMPGINQT